MSAEHNLTVTAQGVDELSGPMRQAAEGLAAAAGVVSNSDREMVRTAKEVELAKKSQISASKQVELAIRAEAAAGKPLEQQLIRLEAETEQLAARMRALVRAGQPVPQAMVQQAGAARDAAEKLREKVNASKALEGQLGTLTTRLGPAALALGAIGAAADGARQALKGVVDDLVASAPELVKIEGEISRTDAALIELKETASDERFKGVAGTIAQGLAIVHSAFNREALEARRQSELANIAIQERERNTRAMMETAQEAAGAANTDTERAISNIRRLAEIERTAEDARRKRAEARRKAAEEQRRLDEEAKRRAEEVARLEVSRAERRMAADRSIAAMREDQLQYQVELQNKVSEEQAEAASVQQQQIEAANAAIAISAQNAAQEHVMLSQRMGAALGTSLAVSIQQAKTLEETMKAAGLSMLDVMLDVAQQMIMAAAAKSAAEAYASQAGIPVVGPLLGAAAAAAAFAFVRSYLGKMQGMADGGWVRGGTPGKDSVPIMAMPGEYVLSVPMVRMLQGLLGSAPNSGPGFAGGGMVGAGGGFGNVTFINNLPPGGLSDAQIERMTRRQVRVLRNMVRNGRAKLGG